ncbi:hypothetical protein UG86_01330 [Staphylococcus aureus]|uniref:Uncharacterized protein n=1 Tax=Staphylococcus aureus TaxID=1280 RepID=A0A7Z1N3V8_STAAU|nr:hypothetical protein UG86_01330 [Staphylococcus aureus]ALO33014.1 hypothetical protein ASU36_13170 [Staphylococcus aureus]AUU49966.1 hypothetical protein RK79_003815 [Staphylococcus aureus]MBG1035796.1 hypothetical protein [Staphylococcus aureus]MCB4384632.1 hypothetical protein [Staphylococcus aureus]
MHFSPYYYDLNIVYILRCPYAVLRFVMLYIHLSFIIPELFILKANLWKMQLIVYYLCTVHLKLRVNLKTPTYTFKYM